MSKLTVTYDGSNIIDELEVEGNVAINYNDSTIATISGGKKLLKSNDNVAVSDIRIGKKILRCKDKVMASDLIVTVEDATERWDTPIIELDGDTLSTDIMAGVEKYNVYVDSEYIGYIDNDNVFHDERSV